MYAMHRQLTTGPVLQVQEGLHLPRHGLPAMKVQCLLCFQQPQCLRRWAMPGDLRCQNSPFPAAAAAAAAAAADLACLQSL